MWYVNLSNSLVVCGRVFVTPEETEAISAQIETGKIRPSGLTE
jgi:hypothetical protein